MKIKIFGIVIVALVFCVSVCEAKSVNVKGGITKRGTYKSPHLRTSPNKTKIDNWSAKGNVNPYTGKSGTKKVY